MSALVDKKFDLWTRMRGSVESRVSVFEQIRNIPYASIPELIDFTRYHEILALGKGSCTPKHFLLCDMYERLGLPVLYTVVPFRWDEVEVEYPRKLRELASALQVSHHLACLVEIEGVYALVDATLDPGLEILGLPVNKEWDGFSSTALAITPCGEPEVYHPLEAHLVRARRDEKSMAFYNELNLWLEKVRAGCTQGAGRQTE